MTIKELKKAMLNGIDVPDFETELSFLFSIDEYQELLDFANTKHLKYYTEALKVRINYLKKSLPGYTANEDEG